MINTQSQNNNKNKIRFNLPFGSLTEREKAKDIRIFMPVISLILATTNFPLSSSYPPEKKNTQDTFNNVAGVFHSRHFFFSGDQRLHLNANVCSLLLLSLPYSIYYSLCIPPLSAPGGPVMSSDQAYVDKAKRLIKIYTWLRDYYGTGGPVPSWVALRCQRSCPHPPGKPLRRESDSHPEKLLVLVKLPANPNVALRHVNLPRQEGYLH